MVNEKVNNVIAHRLENTLVVNEESEVEDEPDKRSEHWLSSQQYKVPNIVQNSVCI